MNVSALQNDNLGKPLRLALVGGGFSVTTVSDREGMSAEEVNRLVLAIATTRERDAFAELFNFAAPRIKAFMMRTGSSPELAEEIAQEAMLIVWRKASYFDPARASAMTWIFTIARNLRIDFQRKAKSSQKPPEYDPSSIPAMERTPEEIIFVRADEDRVHAALQALGPEQEEILRLSFFRDCPHAEIAKELDLPLGTVKSRIRRALARLKTMLEETL